ncbi:MAG: hypothetical protein R2695_09335 [Acidimicrobiales bacterium]
MFVIGLATGGTAGWVLTAVGVVASRRRANVCLIALLKAPFSGQAALQQRS